MKYKGVFFDFDYTLGDATDAIMAGFTHGFVTLDRTAPEREAVRPPRGISARSNGRRLAALRAFFRYLLEQGLISENPVAEIDAPKTGRSLPKALSIAEIDNLLALPEVMPPLTMRTKARPAPTAVTASGTRSTSRCAIVDVPSACVSSSLARVGVNS